MMMGDRVLIQLKHGERVSPCLYLHWGGSDAKKLIEALKIRMAPQPGDLDYSFARLVEIACADDPGGCMSIGVFNQDTQLSAEDSHGDGGCLVVNVSDWTTKHFG